MGVKIYIWAEGGGSVGHGSMTLGDGTHISWWPKEDKKKSPFQRWKSVDAEPATSYEQDVEWENKKPADFIYEIPSGKLDEAAIRSWWNEFKTTNTYHIAFKNCCSAVYSALKKGGAEKLVPFPGSLISTPANLKEYAEKLQKATI